MKSKPANDLHLPIMLGPKNPSAPRARAIETRGRHGWSLVRGGPEVRCPGENQPRPWAWKVDSQRRGKERTRQSKELIPANLWPPLRRGKCDSSPRTRHSPVDVTVGKRRLALLEPLIQRRERSSSPLLTRATHPVDDNPRIPGTQDAPPLCYCALIQEWQVIWLRPSPS